MERGETLHFLVHDLIQFVRINSSTRIMFQNTVANRHINQQSSVIYFKRRHSLGLAGDIMSL